MARTFNEWVALLLDRLVAVTGKLDGEVRNAILRRGAETAGVAREGGEVPEALRAWVDVIAKHAWRATDEEVAKLRAAGYDEDAIFEAALCAATGASWARYERGLAVIRGEAKPAATSAGGQ
jgi:hypothetical protein